MTTPTDAPTRFARLRTPTARLAGVGVLAGAALSVSPLTAVHGVESALGLGLVLPPFVAASAAARSHRSGGEATGAVVSSALWRAFTAWGSAVLLLLLGSLRVRQCTPLEGLGYMVLGPGVGVALAAATGLVVGAFSWPRWSTPRRVALLASFVPLAAMGVGLYRFWTTSAIRIFGAYAGMFPGTLYDENVGFPAAFATQRAATSLAIVTLLMLFFGAREASSGRLRLRVLRGRRGALATATLAGGLYAASLVYAPELGHATTRAFVDQTLGRVHRGERCILHVPRELRRVEPRSVGGGL